MKRSFPPDIIVIEPENRDTATERKLSELYDDIFRRKDGERGHEKTTYKNSSADDTIP